MIYLEKVTVTESPYFEKNRFLKGFTFDCTDVNLFVGDQGTGKSTLLRLMQENSKKLGIVLSEHAKTHGANSFYFDTEHHNPRTTDPQMYTTINGEDTGIGYMAACVSRFKSHGEIMQDIIVENLFEAKDRVILLDEPESGLSVRNQLRLVQAVKTAVQNNCQLFIATHCVPLIEAYDIISFDHKKRMAGEDYLKKLRKKYASSAK